MVKPTITSFGTIAPLIVQQYERYLPTAFDESLTILQKVNKIIKWLDSIGVLTNDIITQWNTVMEWVMNDGLTEEISAKLDAMVLDGTLGTIIDEQLLGGLHDSQVLASEGNRFKIVGGTIRNDGTGWTIITDATHKPINLLSVTINPEDAMTLLLTYSYDGSSIGTLVVSPDETFAKGGLICGGSVGDDKAILSISAPLIMQTTGKTVVNTDKWHKSVVSIAAKSDNTGLILTHPAQITGQAPVVSLSEGGSNNGIGGEIRTDYTLTTTTLTYYQYLHGYVTYNGTDWSIASDNVDKASVSWDATNNALKIEHPAIDEEYAISISGGNGFRPTIISQGVGNMLVQFVNSAGTIMTTQDALMKVNFMRFTKVKSNYPSGLKVNIHRGYIQCDPADIIEPFGNFWIYGIHGE